MEAFSVELEPWHTQDRCYNSKISPSFIVWALAGEGAQHKVCIRQTTIASLFDETGRNRITRAWSLCPPRGERGLGHAGKGNKISRSNDSCSRSAVGAFSSRQLPRRVCRQHPLHRWMRVGSNLVILLLSSLSHVDMVVGRVAGQRRVSWVLLVLLERFDGSIHPEMDQMNPDGASI